MEPFLAAHESLDVNKIMESIQKKIKEKKDSGVLKEQEIHEIEEMEVLPLPDFQEIPNIYRSHLYSDLGPAEEFHPGEIDETGMLKGILKKVRSLFFPLIRFMTRPLFTDIHRNIFDLQRLTPTTVQSREYVKLLHNTINNVIVEMTKLKIEEEMLKTKVKILEDKLEFLENRERAIEKKIAAR